MVARFLIDTLELILAVLDRLGLLSRGRVWHRDRIVRRVSKLFESRPAPPPAPETRHATCPACRAFISREETTCPRCGADVRRGRRALGSAVGALVTPAMGSASTTLSAAIITIFVACAVAAGGFASFLSLPIEQLYRLGGMVPFRYADFAWWRLVTAIFLHGGITHVFFNAYALSLVGPRVEEEIGGRRFLVLFMLTGVAGFLASAAIGRGISVGASGSIFGLIGFGLAYGHFTSDLSLRADMTRWALIGFLLIPLLSFALGMNVDHAAHAGGFLAGLPFGALVRGPVARPRPLRERLWAAAAIIAGLLPLVSFALAIATALEDL